MEEGFFFIVQTLVFQITAHSDVNHMTSGVIATSCGPSLFPYLPPSNANQMTKFLIDFHTTIFKTDTASPTSPSPSTELKV